MNATATSNYRDGTERKGVSARSQSLLLNVRHV